MNHLAVLCLFVACSLAAVPKRVIDPKLNWRVVGGSDAPDGAHPHQISLQHFGSHGCGGSIVHNEWVITAAHCVDRSEPSDLSIVVGTNKLSQGGTRYAVLEIHHHRGFDPDKFQNDVAILKVEPITYTDKIQPIVLEREEVRGDVEVTLSGWGSTTLGGATPDKLQEINLKTTTVEYCKNSHNDTPVIATQICTLTKVGEGACHGDSGGPLTRTVDGARKLIGTVSWGKPCAKGLPDVYSRVSSFYDWFNNICNCF